MGPLSNDAAREAISMPIERESAEINEDAINLIINKTKAYPTSGPSDATCARWPTWGPGPHRSGEDQKLGIDVGTRRHTR